MLANKKIVLGITGSIAAYKSAVLVRLLVKEGAEVRVVMSKSAADFITPLTLSVLSKNPVLSELANPDKSIWNNHVELGIWADVFLIAPATANTISKMANGMCDNLLMAVYFASKCSVFFAPAMDVDMYEHPATKFNIKRLHEFGNMMIASEKGELASGLEGEGRMAEPENILEVLKNHFGTVTMGVKKKSQPLDGLKALVTAGPTYEAIDPVRFIGNYSSGKMGFAIAMELAARGAEVKLISGPTALVQSHPLIEQHNVNSASEMFEECVANLHKQNIVVMSAAVADYTPEKSATQKIKKEAGLLNIPLIPTRDILGALGKLKRKKQLLVGFALETEDELANAKVKLTDKNLDMIVLNSLNDKGAGFHSDFNKVTIIYRNNKIERYKLKPKSEVASDIVNSILKMRQ